MIVDDAHDEKLVNELKKLMETQQKIDRNLQTIFLSEKITGLIWEAIAVKIIFHFN